jgi:hypothetical protein
MSKPDSSLASSLNRRSFLRNVGAATVATAALAASGSAPGFLFAQNASNSGAPMDTPKEIFTAALVAEDLATVFYYNGLVQPVIHDNNLAGMPYGTATHVTAKGSASNVGYLRAALSEEIAHANLFRSLLGIGSPSKDPYQDFYFDKDTFTSLNPFIATLEALEYAFIGAYLAAIQEFAGLASQGKTLTLDGNKYTPADLVYFAKVAASIMGVEAEHRALGRAIVPTLIPANQLNYESTDGITSVYNGKTSAVAALTPFLSPGGNKQVHSLMYTLGHAGEVSLQTSGNPPSM